MTPPTSRALRLAILLAGAAAVFPAPARAHDIPARVTVLSFFRPQGNRLTVLVRAPLEAMRDIQLPLRAEGFLELARVEPVVRDAARLWIAGSLQVYENGVQLTDPEISSVRIALPTDRSFEQFSGALAHLHAAPLDSTTELVWGQALMDVELTYPIGSDSAAFSVMPTMARLGVRTSTVMRFLPPGGSERAYQFLGDPGLVRLDPAWYHAFFQFVKLGFQHILDGIDHLLFLLCLIIPFRRLRPLVAIVTSFTLAHSVTLIASTLGLAPSALWFPPLVETLIALSILFMAFENIVGAKQRRRWALAFGFGLIHGFGFSFALRESLQFAGRHLTASLVAFNVGVELGQVFVLILAVPVLGWVFRRAVRERIGIILLSALVAHTAWHWMLDRAGVLRQYDFQWPTLDAVFLAGALRALMLALIAGGVAWIAMGLVRRLQGPAEEAPVEAVQ